MTEQNKIQQPPKAVVEPDITPLSYQVGGMERIGTKEILFPDANNIAFTPIYETQAMTYFDTWGCVPHSLETAIQTLIKKQIKSFSKGTQEWLREEIYLNKEPNFSDRDLVVLSGTKPGVGNSGSKVLQTAQEKGLIAEALAPWDVDNRNPEENITEVYYAYGRTEESEKKAKEWNKRFEIIGTWVYTRDLKRLREAFQTGVVQVYVNAWHINEDGEYYNPTGNITHATIGASFDEKKIMDTYKPTYKTLASWGDIGQWALKINIKEKNMTEKPQIENNTLVMLVEGGGNIGLYLDGKIIVDDPAKLLVVFIARNASEGEFTKGKVANLTKEEWELFEKRSL